MFFISFKKLFSLSRHSNFCNFSPFFPHSPDSKGQMEVELFMMSWIGLHAFAQYSKITLYYIIKLGQITHNK